jgi:hypothetical protein
MGTFRSSSCVCTKILIYTIYESNFRVMTERKRDEFISLQAALPNALVELLIMAVKSRIISAKCI